MEINYYTYQDEYFECENCSWKGKGKDTESGEIFSALFEIDCPSCREPITHISYPTTEETLKYGSDKEKKEARERNKWIQKVQEMQLTNVKQLPKIDKHDITFKLDVSEDLKYILLKYDDNTIWKEIRTFEYYERYLEIGELLKLKYKKKIAGFIPSNEIDRVYFYGDCGSYMMDIIDEFQESFKKPS